VIKNEMDYRREAKQKNRGFVEQGIERIGDKRGVSRKELRE